MRYRTTVAAAVLALTASVSGAQVPEAEMRFQQALRFLNEGQPDLAVREINEALRKDPKNAFFLKGLGVAYTRLADRCAADQRCRADNNRKAVEAAQRAVAENPEYVDARQDLGIALLRIGKRAEGRAELIKALNDPEIRAPEMTAYNVGFSFYEDKQYDEASLWFRAAVQKNKSFAAAYVGLSDVFAAVGQLESAIAQIEIGLKETNGNAAVQLAHGDLLFKAGRFSDARAAFEAVVKKDPSGPTGRGAAARLAKFPR
jgi:Tfp pilus assembly protein PilF